MPLVKLADLAFEIDRDTITLEQDAGTGEVHYVTLHQLQLRMLAEQAGILPARDGKCHSEAMAHAWQAQATRLARQLRTLSERIDRQHTQLLWVAEKGRECVDEECAYAEATYELAQEFVADLPPTMQEPSDTPAVAELDALRGRLRSTAAYFEQLLREHGEVADKAFVVDMLQLVLDLVREHLAGRDGPMPSAPDVPVSRPPIASVTHSDGPSTSRRESGAAVTPGAARQRRYRERKARERDAGVTNSVTPRDVTGDVTRVTANPFTLTP